MSCIACSHYHHKTPHLGTCRIQGGNSINPVDHCSLFSTLDPCIINTIEVEFPQVEYDPVNKPKHYQVIGKYEAIHIIQALLSQSYLSSSRAYKYGNVLKYVLRATKKKDFDEDLRKAAKYIEMILEDKDEA
jgi:hypothetical protein